MSDEYHTRKHAPKSKEVVYGVRHYLTCSIGSTNLAGVNSFVNCLIAEFLSILVEDKLTMKKPYISFKILHCRKKKSKTQLAAQEVTLTLYSYACKECIKYN